ADDAREARRRYGQRRQQHTNQKSSFHSDASPSPVVRNSLTPASADRQAKRHQFARNQACFSRNRTAARPPDLRRREKSASWTTSGRGGATKKKGAARAAPSCGTFEVKRLRQAEETVRVVLRVRRAETRDQVVVHTGREPVVARRDVEIEVRIVALRR